MSKSDLFKPFPTFIHVIGWVVYFLWIGYVNIGRHGAGHLFVILGIIPVMLGIAYLNWYAFRQFFRKGIKWKGLVVSTLCLVLLLLVGYQVLYGSSNPIAKRVLKNPDSPAFHFTAFFIDVAGFYWISAYKGLGLAAAEIIFNLARARLAYLKRERHDMSEQRKRDRIRKWISHFLGNMTQSLLYMVKRGHGSFNRLESFAIIGASASRIMARENNSLILLDEELRLLRRMTTIYPMHLLEMEISEHTQDIKIVPLTLLALYKNMYKHGDFQEGTEALFKVDCAPDRMVITTKNKIAARSAWIFEKGGTGQDQLADILQDEYGEAARVVYKVESDTFFLQIEILLTYGRVQNDFEIIGQAEEAKGDGPG